MKAASVEKITLSRYIMLTNNMRNPRQRLFQKKLHFPTWHLEHLLLQQLEMPYKNPSLFLNLYFGNTDCPVNRFCPPPNFIASCLVTLTSVELVSFLNAILSLEMI